MHHREFGPGWVQGSGVGRVTVRFETPTSKAPGRVRTFRVDDPDLEPSEPLPLVAEPGETGVGEAGDAEGQASSSSSPASRPKSRSEPGSGSGAAMSSP